MIPRIRGVAVCLGLLLGALTAASRVAAAPQDALDAIVLRAVRANYEALHLCYRRSLAEDRSREGTVFVRVTLGARDTIASAKLERDELEHPATIGCLVRTVGSWRLPGAARAGAERGSEVVIPISFQAAARQFAIRREDVVPRPAGTGARVQRLLHARNVGARGASLVLLTLEARKRMALAASASADQVLYLLDGSGRLESGKHRRRLRGGTAIWLPPGAGATLEAGARSLSLLHFFLAAGPQKVAPARAPLVVRGGRQRRLADGKLRVTPLLDRARLGHGRFYLGLLSAPRGLTVAEHAHLASAEVLYVLSGAGQLTLDGNATTLGGEQALYLPGGSAQQLRVESDLQAIQLFVPAGPEARSTGRRVDRRGAQD